MAVRDWLTAGSLMAAERAAARHLSADSHAKKERFQSAINWLQMSEEDQARQPNKPTLIEAMENISPPKGGGSISA